MSARKNDCISRSTNLILKSYLSEYLLRNWKYMIDKVTISISFFKVILLHLFSLFKKHQTLLTNLIITSNFMSNNIVGNLIQGNIIG